MFQHAGVSCVFFSAFASAMARWGMGIREPAGAMQLCDRFVCPPHTMGYLTISQFVYLHNLRLVQLCSIKFSQPSYFEVVSCSIDVFHLAPERDFVGNSFILWSSNFGGPSARWKITGLQAGPASAKLQLSPWAAGSPWCGCPEWMRSNFGGKRSRDQVGSANHFKVVIWCVRILAIYICGNYCGNGRFSGPS
jgi:hypothetical protein